MQFTYLWLPTGYKLLATTRIALTLQSVCAIFMHIPYTYHRTVLRKKMLFAWLLNIPNYYRWQRKIFARNTYRRIFSRHPISVFSTGESPIRPRSLWVTNTVHDLARGQDSPAARGWSIRLVTWSNWRVGGRTHTSRRGRSCFFRPYRKWRCGV